MFGKSENVGCRIFGRRETSHKDVDKERLSTLLRDRESPGGFAIWAVTEIDLIRLPFKNRFTASDFVSPLSNFLLLLQRFIFVSCTRYVSYSIKNHVLFTIFTGKKIWCSNVGKNIYNITGKLRAWGIWNNLTDILSFGVYLDFSLKLDVYM